MSQVISKFIPITQGIKSTCMDYVHPWTDSCLQAICGLYLYCILDCLRIYGSVYVVVVSIGPSIIYTPQILPENRAIKIYLVLTIMVQVLSRLFQPNTVECCELHFFTTPCVDFWAQYFIKGLIYSLRTYTILQGATLLMKGRIPTKNDIKKTIHGILQSTAFLSGTAFGYSLFLCSLRKLLGHFNVLTVSAIPAFLASVFAIIIERPSRRTLLALYVSNVATETVWNMAVSRNMVRNIRHGDVALFGGSIAILLMYFKGGYHKNSNSEKDPMFGLLRFVVGPYEENDYNVRSSQVNSFYRQQVQNVAGDETSRCRSGSWQKRSKKNLIFHIITQMLRIYKKIIYKVKCLDRHQACPHPFSCLYYTMQGTAKMFGIGLAIQISLKLVLNMKRLFQAPSTLKPILFRKQTLNLACFLGAFSGLFRASLCLLRRTTGKDSPKYAIPAGLIAGLAYTQYPDTTVALYVLWKAAQITYNHGIAKNVVPNIPGFTEFLYCFSTAILFHAAIIEPTNLRTSYWKFLHSISGGRIACMSRVPLDVWGYNTSESLKTVLELTKTKPIVYF